MIEIPAALAAVVSQWEPDWFQLHCETGVWFVCSVGGQLLEGEAAAEALLLLDGRQSEWWELSDMGSARLRGGESRSMLESWFFESADDLVVEWRPADNNGRFIAAVTSQGPVSVFQRLLLGPLLELGSECRVRRLAPSRTGPPVVVFRDGVPVATLAAMAVSDDLWARLRTGG